MIALSSVLGPRFGARARHVYVRYDGTTSLLFLRVEFSSICRFGSKINVQKNRVDLHAGSWKLLTLYGYM